MISPRLLSLVRCPECHGELGPAKAGPHSDLGPAEAGPHNGGELTCLNCGRQYRGAAGDFMDLRPVEAFSEQTKYLDESLHADARHERVSPPLLGSKIRNDMLRKFLDVQPSDLVVDLGCGSGRALLWNRDWQAAAVGIDISPFFSNDARKDIDLLLGDLRKLPFADATFDKAFSLDVLEHLSPEAVRAMLTEAARVLKPGGALFVYTHVRKNAWIAKGLRGINKLAQALDRRGLVDLRQEHLRKSDHLNPLKDVPDLERVVSESGFRIARIRFYTPLVGGFVENILVRMAERAMAKKAAKRLISQLGAAGAKDVDAQAIKEARTAAKQQIAKSPMTYAALRVLSAAMKLDLLLFGRITSGPFFALLVREPR